MTKKITLLFFFSAAIAGGIYAQQVTTPASSVIYPEYMGVSKPLSELFDKVEDEINAQTIFRESEAQTDPYTPEYIEDHTNGIPEVLGIKDLVFGRGLPASKTEMELIS